MSRPEPPPESPFQRDADAQTFNEPWEAQAFALTVKLYEAGHFTWREWADTLGAVLAEADAANPAGDGGDYYRHWLTALERLTDAKQLSTASERNDRKQAWADAYATTPHGRPVSFG